MSGESMDVAGVGLVLFVLLVVGFAVAAVATAAATALTGVIVRFAEWYIERRSRRIRQKEIDS